MPPDAVIGLIPAAQGGTSIASWGKNYSGSNRYYDDDYLYPHALERALEAARLGTLAGILWNQGESDAGSAENDDGASYRARLHQLISDLRTDLGKPELPFIAATLGPWRTNSDAINSVFLSLPTEVGNTATVNTLDPEVAPLLVNNPSDTPHYLSSSYRLLGQLYAKAFAPWWNPGKAFVHESGAGLRAGGDQFELGFSQAGILQSFSVDSVALLPESTSSAGWFLAGATDPEPLTYSPNPPLSFKWRSPRTMAAWTVDERRFGVVLANNDIAPATFRIGLSDQHLVAIRTPQGTWQSPAGIPDETSVNGLLWDLPDGTRLLWQGSATLHTVTPDSPVLSVTLAPKAVADWSWDIGEFPLPEPRPFAVYQRTSEREGRVPFTGVAPSGTVEVEIQLEGADGRFGPLPETTMTLPADPLTGAFTGQGTWPAGGWYTANIEARGLHGEKLATASAGPFGIGEVFVVAGQSNSTNSGQFRTRPVSPLVSAYSGSAWRWASDPLPGTHDNATGGSFQPSLGDALVQHFGVPVGFASTGQGGSAIRHWQPDFEHNFESNTFYNGLYHWTLHRMRQLGPDGFRALLWHQGESDSSRGESTDPAKTDIYFAALKRLLDNWRADAGWDFPAVVAKATLWPLDNAIYGGDPHIRAAQQRAWDEGIALEGPDTDQLGLEYRQDNSASRVHFNDAGLKRHGDLWADALTPFISRENLRSMRPDLKIFLEDSTIRLRWNQRSSQSIQLESSETLDGPWLPRHATTTGPEAEDFEYTDSESLPDKRRFYRLRIEGDAAP